MTLAIDPLRPDDHDLVRALAGHPSLAREFEILLPPRALDDALADPFAARDASFVARRDGRPIGFAISFLLPGTEHDWAMIRIGVVETWRRRGAGTALLDACRAALVSSPRGPVTEHCLAAWLPAAEAERFADRRGFRRVRSFWRMERPRGAVAAPAWPDGVQIRTWNGTEEDLVAWHRAYSDSFARHYHFVRSSVEDVRAMTRAHHFRPDGLVLAWQDGACVGFCRNQVSGDRGEVALLGVVPAAQQRGLGRALLRWSVDWLQSTPARVVELLVDGENESALGLYRGEGFEVAATRAIWSRPL